MKGVFMVSLHRQKGMSLLGAALLLFLIVFFGLLFVKMSGTYYDHFTIKKTIDTALEGQQKGRFVRADFESRLNKNFQINGIKLDLKKSFTYEKGNNPKMTLDYEKRVRLFANVDVVMAFNQEYEL